MVCRKWSAPIRRGAFPRAKTRAIAKRLPEPVFCRPFSVLQDRNGSCHVISRLFVEF